MEATARALYICCRAPPIKTRFVPCRLLALWKPCSRAHRLTACAHCSQLADAMSPHLARALCASLNVEESRKAQYEANRCRLQANAARIRTAR
eukprot:4113901-Pleurochrysis_carterae.AAC.8